MILIFERPMRDQIRDALREAGAQNKTVKRIEVTRAEFDKIRSELGIEYFAATATPQGRPHQCGAEDLAPHGLRLEKQPARTRSPRH